MLSVILHYTRTKSFHVANVELDHLAEMMDVTLLILEVTYSLEQE